MATKNGKTMEELQSEIALLEAQLQLAKTAKAKTKKGISFRLQRKGPQLAATAPEFVPSGGTPSYTVPRPTETDRESVEDDYCHDEHVSTIPPRTLVRPPARTIEAPPVPTATATPNANSEWFKFMREEREASDRRMREMLEALNLGRAFEWWNKQVYTPSTTHE